MPLLLALGAFGVVACSDPPPATVDLTPTPATTPPPPATTPPPDVGPAIRTIYEGYAANPNGYDRLPALSAYFIRENRRIDEACARGGDDARCRGDRFACQTNPPRKAGKVVAVRVNGEQPGVSATVDVTVRFGTEETAVHVDTVLVDGAWRIDQVRCDVRED